MRSVSRCARTLLGCFVLQFISLPALAELRYFYCFVPDPAAGVVYASDTQPVGPIAERSNYGSEFVAYLKRQGLAASVSTGYCTMRATEAEIVQAQRDLLSGCRECKGATRVSSVQWNRQSVSAPAPAQIPVPNAVTPAPVATSRSAPEPSSPNAARAEVCIPANGQASARRQECVNQKSAPPADEKPTPKRQTPPTQNRTQPPKQTRNEPPKDTTSTPAPAPRRKEQACTTLPRDRDTVIVIADPEIFVTMSPGTFLYMRDHLGNELKLGYGKHRVRPGTYKLGIYGVTDPRNPLKQTLHACVTYHADF
jgi:hypothetical protein